MAEHESKPFVPARQLDSPYPLIDSDPHAKRVFSYARPSDYLYGTALGALAPATMLYWEKVAPSYVGKGGFAKIMRLNGAIGFFAAFCFVYERSSARFYGMTENRREVEMDMREMVDKVKRGEPLYGKSNLSEYMQGVASRNSRFSGVMFHLLPWMNFVNHNQHGVDTAKYYQQAERELEADRRNLSS